VHGGADRVFHQRGFDGFLGMLDEARGLFVKQAYRSSVSKRDKRSASCRRARSRPTRTTPVGSPR
jgi:hypothetical protein